jgi:hypothetical protein
MFLATTKQKKHNHLVYLDESQGVGITSLDMDHFHVVVDTGAGWEVQGANGHVHALADPPEAKSPVPKQIPRAM